MKNNPSSKDAIACRYYLYVYNKNPPSLTEPTPTVINSIFLSSSFHN